MMKTLISLSISILFLTRTSIVLALPVIPGATGFGIETPAGRGGDVYVVTNVTDSGPGSLRDCAQQSGPRVCVFEVSGTIQLEKEIVVRNPYLTIAGQTAPSPGISIRGAGLRIESTHDVLVQHLRVRVGDDPGGLEPKSRHGLTITAYSGPAYNIVIDHVSISWALGKNVNLWYEGVSDVTIRNSIVSEALDQSPESSKSMGLLVGPGIKRVSIIGSLFAHNYQRNPRTREESTTEFHNNVIYNWGGEPALFTEGSINLVGNHFQKGISSTENVVRAAESAVIYALDNIGFSYVGAPSPGVPGSGYDPIPAREVLAYVLSRSGARPSDRDNVDERIINDVRNGTGRIINNPKEVGGWPSIPINRHLLAVPDNPHGDDDRNGYTNLEEWLHKLSEQDDGKINPPQPPGLNPVL